MTTVVAPPVLTSRVVRYKVSGGLLHWLSSDLAISLYYRGMQAYCGATQVILGGLVAARERTTSLSRSLRGRPIDISLWQQDKVSHDMKWLVPDN